MAPPPGPPPPPPPPPAAPTGGANVEDAAGALFAEISALGEGGLRGGLKKATRGPVNETAPTPSFKPISAPVKKSVGVGGTPKCALVGKKWEIEFQNGSKDLEITTNMRQTAYIYKCHDSLIKIYGKVNAIVLDSVTKSGLIFEEALASVELVNCKDVLIQNTKTSPAMSIDGCTAITYYMSPNFAEAQIITAKSAAINLIRPTDNDDMVETPIPEQFCTTWKGDNWVTECVDHSD